MQISEPTDSRSSTVRALGWYSVGSNFTYCNTRNIIFDSSLWSGMSLGLPGVGINSKTAFENVYQQSLDMVISLSQRAGFNVVLKRVVSVTQYF